MRNRTKGLIILQLLGASLALVLIGFRFGRTDAFTTTGWSSPAIVTLALAAGIMALFNYLPFKAMTRFSILRLFGLGKKKEKGELTVETQEDKRKNARYFSPLFLLSFPLAMGGPVYVFLKGASTLGYLAGAGAFGLVLGLALFVPASDGTLARNKLLSKPAPEPEKNQSA